MRLEFTYNARNSGSFLSLLCMAAALEGAYGLYFSVNSFWIWLLWLISLVTLIQLPLKEKVGNIARAWTLSFFLTLAIFLLSCKTLFYCHLIPSFLSAFSQLPFFLTNIPTAISIDPYTHANLLVIKLPSGPESISITLEKVQYFSLISVCAYLMIKNSKRDLLLDRTVKFLYIVVAFVLYASFRFGLIAAFSAEWSWVRLWWNPIIAVLSYVPLSLLYGYEPVFLMTKVSAKSAHGGRARWIFGGLSLLAVTLFLIRISYVPIGPYVPGDVLIDDAHSNWEWSDIPITRDAFGEKAVYNASSFKEMLARFYRVDVNRDKEISDSMLNGYRVLILKTPTKPYNDQEKDSIRSFLKRGGSVLIFGDHTNLFGMGAYLNDLLDGTGLSVGFDDQFGLVTGGTTMIRNTFTMPNPVLRELEGMGFLTSCTINGFIGSQISAEAKMGVEEVDYAHVNFFGDIKTDPSEYWGQFCQIAWTPFGKGKILLFSDSTLISSFCLYFDKKPVLMYNLLNFLQHDNSRFSYLYEESASELIAAIGVIGAIGLFVCIHSSLELLGVAAAMCLLMLALPPISRNYQTSNINKIIKDSSYINFETSGCSFKVPAMVDFNRDTLKDPYAYDTFIFSFIKSRYQVYLDNPLHIAGNPLLRVFINPELITGSYLAKANVNKLEGQGKKLIIFNGTDESILPTISKSVHAPAAQLRSRGDVDGRKYSLFEITKSEGNLWILFGGSILSREFAGPIYNVPDQLQREGSEFHYALIDLLTEKLTVDQFSSKLNDIKRRAQEKEVQNVLIQ